MSDIVATPSLALKKTIRLFAFCAIVLGGLSLAISGYFTEDVMTRAENAAKANLQILWDSYQHYYVEDSGRVVRPDRNFDTVSEGQAYAMLRAVWQKDRATFDRVYAWTENNLSRLGTHYNDHLLAWHFRVDSLGNAAVADVNSAIDADLDYALALFLAARQWTDGRAPGGHMPYREKAVAVTESIMSKAVLTHPNGELVLLPWPQSERMNLGEEVGQLEINPSYFSPGHYRVFNYETQNQSWGKLVEDTYRQLSRIMNYEVESPDSVRVVPDWIMMNPNGSFSLHKEKGMVSGWEAFRTWWRLRVDYDFSGNPAARAFIEKYLPAFLRKSMEGSGGEVAAASDLDGNPTVEYTNAGMTGTYSWVLRDFEPSLSRTMQRQAYRGLRHEKAGREEYMYFSTTWDGYYTNSWAWLSMTEGTSSFPYGQLYNFHQGSTGAAQSANLASAEGVR